MCCSQLYPDIQHAAGHSALQRGSVVPNLCAKSLSNSKADKSSLLRSCLHIDLTRTSFTGFSTLPVPVVVK